MLLQVEESAKPMTLREGMRMMQAEGACIGGSNAGGRGPTGGSCLCVATALSWWCHRGCCWLHLAATCWRHGQPRLEEGRRQVQAATGPSTL